MLLGALIDAGVRPGRLKADLARLRLPPFQLTARLVRRGPFAARLVTVTPRRPLPRQPSFEQVTRRIRRSGLPEAVIGPSLACVRALRDAEIALHGHGLPDAFRGLELIDTLVDIVGAVAGLRHLGITDLSVSPVNLGRGLIASQGPIGGHHDGPMPVPSPAAARLLTGFSVYSDGPATELTTPTGAALIRTLARQRVSLPPMRLRGVGHGAGHRRLDPWPNMVRLFVGDGSTERAAPAPAVEETIVELETNLDDYTPQWFDYLRDRLFAAGALDVYLTSIVMKQGRPATQVTVLARPDEAPALTAILFDETPALGVRVRDVQRWTLPRHNDRLLTPDGPVRVKLVRTRHGIDARPEYRDCRAIAERTGRPLRDVMRRLEELARRRFGGRHVRTMGVIRGRRASPPDSKR